MKEALAVCGKRSCGVLGHRRPTQRSEPMPVEAEQMLTDEIGRMSNI